MKLYACLVIAVIVSTTLHVDAAFVQENTNKVPDEKHGNGLMQRFLVNIGGLDRNIEIRVRNKTPYKFEADGVYFSSGTSDKVLQPELLPNRSVVYEARKGSGIVLRGVAGVLCYYNVNEKGTFCVMFSVPFNCIVYANRWNVKLFTGKKAASREIYKQMYHNNFMIGDDRYHERNLRQGIMVKGVMSSSGAAELLVTITTEKIDYARLE